MDHGSENAQKMGEVKGEDQMHAIGVNDGDSGNDPPEGKKIPDDETQPETLNQRTPRVKFEESEGIQDAAEVQSVHSDSDHGIEPRGTSVAEEAQVCSADSVKLARKPHQFSR